MMGHRSGTDTEKIPCSVPIPCPKIFAFSSKIQLQSFFDSFAPNGFAFL
jgi:hypothetical protein